jgi:hypothetical protein
MSTLLAPSIQPLFIAGSVEAKAAARYQNLTYTGGAITGPVGTLDYFFDVSKSKTNFCQAPSVNVSRKQHIRTRVIGGATTTVSASTFALTKYPFVDDQSGQAGTEMALIDSATGDSWVVRRRGPMEDLIKAICDGGLAASRVFYIRSQRGRTFGPFVPASTTP